MIHQYLPNISVFFGIPVCLKFWKHVGLSECSILGKSTYPKKRIHGTELLNKKKIWEH